MCPYVNICVYIAPGANIDEDRIARDIAISEYIWHPITFKIDDISILDEAYRFHNGEISYMSSLKSQPKVTSLFAECAERASQSDIYICYIGSDYFQEQSVIACAYSLSTNKQIKGYIVLTNAASTCKNMYTLAHELGHILFTRREQDKLTNADPECPNGSEHHPSPTNLMHYIIPPPHKSQIDCLLTNTQRELSLKSPLLRKEKK
ncbi:ImmA/IrrE family metallo-endopeptidase [Bacillus sp. CGMCC 1.60114]|uniref:ImmA/IrrE family metallo-endopeptidase n=1 Tax=unclassified Bacillus (in: firmicutes) TaxID=185979 RepID=UPI00364042D4